MIIIKTENLTFNRLELEAALRLVENDLIHVCYDLDDDEVEIVLGRKEVE